MNNKTETVLFYISILVTLYSKIVNCDKLSENTRNLTFVHVVRINLFLSHLKIYIKI